MKPPLDQLETKENKHQSNPSIDQQHEGGDKENGPKEEDVAGLQIEDKQSTVSETYNDAVIFMKKHYANMTANMNFNFKRGKTDYFSKETQDQLEVLE